ncbi:sensor histidine kinase [Botrimarina hoheduenensis]|uniref:Sensor histidine kinase YehU n=1 Tax=Botrimarina hoheduenensis TaxID=2528000 RepID=A0A5C5VQ73_9BACT|nr:histidine kinase [Botrimarina hoheduenensis]TWT40085.1 Sensor histidine kinase YehU [Botrimarina hoheduenensis]
MISFARADRDLEDQPDRKLYLLVLAAIALVQLARVLGNSCRWFVLLVEDTEGSFVPSQWWTALDISSCFWLAISPLLAMVVVKHEAPVLRNVLAHLALATAGLLIAGTVVHRVAYAQTVAREQVRGLAPASSASGPRDQQEPSARTKPVRVRQLLAYEDAPAFPTYGFRYWVGQSVIGLTDYVMMALLGYAVVFFRLSEQRSRQAERLRAMLVQSRHDSLCNRLTHHFLFNTLNMISAQTLTNGRDARTCISQLGELLRASIDSLPKGEVRLDEELRNLGIYLSLQQCRFGDNLEYSIDVEPGLERALVPAFLLQPLVENSFEHGFREHTGVARIGVAVRREDQFCRVEVLDNGSDMNADLKLHERYGLGVTRQRLDLQYDHAASIRFEPNQPSGLRVSILIPYRTEMEPTACRN